MAAEYKTQDHTVGINIDNAKIFTYNGRWYEFNATIFNTSDEELKEGKTFSNQFIEKFEYVNQINSLCLTGTLVYHDADGMVSQYVNRNYNHVNVVCTQLKKESVAGENGKTIEKFVKMGREDGADTFSHTFLVEDFSIRGRDEANPNIIIYELKLISANWFKAIANLEYSNYSLPASSPEKNVFKMIAAMMKLADLDANTLSFDRAYALTKDVKTDYVTNGNDSLITIVPFLFNKLYHIDEFTKFSRFFYIVYDVLANDFKVVDYSDSKSSLKCSKPCIVLSLFETSYEQSLFGETNQLGSTMHKKQSDVFNSLFDHKYWKYDREDGTLAIDPDSSIVSTEQIAELFNNKPDDFEEVEDGPTIPKYQAELLPKSFVVADRYFHEMQDTNNDYRVYAKLVEAFLERDAIIVNCEGDITHQPGVVMGIVLDRTIEKESGIIPTKEFEELYKKHRQIENVFMVFKTRHMYKLSAPASYTENVVMARNFLLTPQTVGRALYNRALSKVKRFVRGFLGR